MASVKKILNLSKLLLGWPLSIVAIALIVKYVADNSNNVLAWADKTNPSFLLVSIVFFLIYFLMRAFAWGLMMEMMGYKLKFKENTYAWQFSEIKRYVPGNVWSFLSRATLFERLGVPKKTSGKGILIEIEYLVLSNMIISLLALNLISLYLKQAGSMVYFAFASFTIVVFTFVIFGHNLNKKLSRVLPNFGFARNLMILIVYLVTYLFLSLGMYFAVKSILNLYNFLTIVGFFSFSFLLGYVSLITPSGLGVREGAITYGLSAVITAPVAGFVAIFSRIILVFSELLFTFLVFAWSKKK
jgi:uncharacterized membrane protein YbhN (UPF0104 family)